MTLHSAGFGNIIMSITENKDSMEDIYFLFYSKLQQGFCFVSPGWDV